MPTVVGENDGSDLLVHTVSARAREERVDAMKYKEGLTYLGRSLTIRHPVSHNVPLRRVSIEG